MLNRKTDLFAIVALVFILRHLAGFAKPHSETQVTLYEVTN